MTSKMSATSMTPARPPRWAKAVLWGMILTFCLYFSVVSIRLHDAHRTHKSDLGQIDLPIWNTSQGRLLQRVSDDQISTRLTDHVEPIFLPVSAVFWLWDDVRALLILQVIVLGLGAWPVFHLTYDQLGRRDPGSAERPPGEHPGRRSNGLAAAALAFTLAYLLYPPLQAALVAEFHALPLATPLILFAFLFLQREQWVRFVIFALLVATVQEGMALLTAMLGAYALVQILWRRRKTHQETQETPHLPQTVPLLAAIVVLVGGLVWFYVATFLIIPVYAAEIHNVSETPYAARFAALGDSFTDVLTTMLFRPALVLQVAGEPLRVSYALTLLAPVGFLALLGPEILLLGAPLFLANLLSAYPFQYGGQLHYSAPLAAYVLTASVVGARRLRHLLRTSGAFMRNRLVLRACRSYLLLTGWVLAWSIGVQIAHGYTPIGSQFRFYWPRITEHHRLLDRFTAQIPPRAAVSTMDNLHPHLSHRERLYQFPILADSQYVLLDMAAQTGWNMHPVALQQRVTELLESGEWQVRDAADGYLLLQRSGNPEQPNPGTQLPEAFYSFAQPDAQPQYPVNVSFTREVQGSSRQLRLLGYDILDDPQWRQTGFRLHWQAETPLPAGTQISLFGLSPDGTMVDTSELRPLIQSLWYPAEAWEPGEVVVTDKLPWHLPKRWALGVGVSSSDDWEDPASRWQVATADESIFTPENNSWAWLGTWQRDGDRLEPLPEPELEPVDLTFAGDGWTTRLDGVTHLDRSAPGQDVPLVLRWSADGPASRDYTVFLHLRDQEGRTVAQADAGPVWFARNPTTQWSAGKPVLAAHVLSLPADLSPGVYDVVVGWYFWETQERLARLGADGLPAGDEAVVTQLEVDTTAGPRPDLCCAISPECCTSR